MNRYYIDKLGIEFTDTPQGFNEKDYRQEFWTKQRSEYGFDERETWSLDYTMDLFLYERLCMYKEIASKCINLKFHRFIYKGSELTQLECIDRMIKGLKLNLTLSCYDKERRNDEISEIIDDVYPIYALCKNTLWW